MRIAFVRLATYLLLALLPFQTMASVLERSCADSMPHCAAMTIESGGCCDHAASTFAHRQHGDMPGSGLHHHASCGMATTSCAVAAPMLALPGSVAVLPRPANALPRTSLTVSYRSFVPEALQRPPSILA